MYISTLNEKEYSIISLYYGLLLHNINNNNNNDLCQVCTSFFW